MSEAPFAVVLHTIRRQTDVGKPESVHVVPRFHLDAMHYDDSRIPRLLPAAETASLRGLTEQVLVLKIDGIASVGELRSLLRHIGAIDGSLQKLLERGVIELLPPAPAVVVPDFDANADLAAVFSMLIDSDARRPGEDESAFKERIGADPDQPFYQVSRRELLKGLRSEPDTKLAGQLTRALEEHELVGHFRHWLEKGIIDSNAEEALELISFQRQLDKALLRARDESSRIESPVRS